MEHYKNLSLEDIEGEEWRDVVGYENLYQVSNMGRIKSISGELYRRNYIIKQHITGNGYLSVKLRKCNESKSFRVHKLVALSFLPIIDGLLEINHKDENKNNNCVSNIERCDRKYNVNYGLRNKKVSSKLLNRKDHSKEVIQYIENIIVKTFLSVNEAARFYNCLPSAISRVCRGERNKFHNMYFKYKQ